MGIPKYGVEKYFRHGMYVVNIYDSKQHVVLELMYRANKRWPSGVGKNSARMLLSIYGDMRTWDKICLALPYMIETYNPDCAIAID